MYQLILTDGERKAIDWIGHRDWNGNDLMKKLWECEWHNSTGMMHRDNIDDEIWDYYPNITFQIPENVAWEIFQLWHENEQTIPHFAPELKSKFQTFLDSIV